MHNYMEGGGSGFQKSFTRKLRADLDRAGQSSINETEVFENKQKRALTNGKNN